MKIFTHLKTLWRQKGLALYIFHSIYFNFRYLPFRQAIKLPILLNRPRFDCGKCEIVIDSERPIRTGMIILGANLVPFYPNRGIFLQLRGRLVFKGDCRIGNNSFICLSGGGQTYYRSAF